MTSSTKNVKLGVCQAFYDGVDLGYTQGGVEISVATETHKVNIDQFGKTTINEIIQGREVKAKVPMAETTLRNLFATMPGSTLTTDGVLASASLTFATNPTSGSVTLAGQAFTFQAGASSSVYQVKIGATLAISMQALADAVNLAQLALPLGGITASVSGLVVTFKAGDYGSAGNSITSVSSVVPTATMSSATFVGGVAQTKGRVDVKTGVGVDLLSVAKVLRFHPIGNAANDFSEDFIIYQAATAGALQFSYKTDAERIFNIEFMGYPDSTTGKLFSIGDPAA